MNSLVLPVCIFCAIISFAVCNPGRESRKVNEVLDIVRRIEELLGKEERLREITEIVKIDSTMDRMSKKLDRVVAILEAGAATSGIPSVRGESSTAVGIRDLSGNLEAIDNRLRNLEVAVDKVEETVGKTDFNFAKIEEMERRTTQLKDDMNLKLRKMMNVLTALYEMNKDSKGKNSDEEEPKTKTESTHSVEFLVENLEELERKIKEQFSVLATEIRTEITSLKIVTTSMSSSCNSPPEPEDDEDSWLTPNDNNARSLQSGRQPGRTTKKVEDTLDNLVESLGRTTREIRDEIHQGIQGIDYKLNNLTAIAISQPQCERLEVAESVVSSRRAVHSAPQQSLEKQPRRESCTKVARNVPNPRSCAELRRGGATCDGIYVIFPKGVRAVRVLCDMTTDGGGWTTLMRRGDYDDKMTSFHKNWVSYKNGFGDSEGEFWLGNDVMSLMTGEDDNMLRVHLSAFDGDSVNLDYGSFSVANESSNYRLHIGVPVGSPSVAANSLRYHNNHPFSTFETGATLVS